MRETEERAKQHPTPEIVTWSREPRQFKTRSHALLEPNSLTPGPNKPFNNKQGTMVSFPKRENAARTSFQ